MWKSYVGWCRFVWSCDRMLTAGYCGDCKEVLPRARIVDPVSAWCPKCGNVVTSSCFSVPGWTVGVIVVLSAGTFFGLWL